MRDFFIKALDVLIGVIVVLGFIGVLAFSVITATQGGGVGAALGILIGGILYMFLIAGFMYLGLGVYHNTRRTAEALERR